MRRLVDWRDAGVEFGDLFREKGSKLLSYGCDRWQVWQGKALPIAFYFMFAFCYLLSTVYR